MQSKFEKEKTIQDKILDVLIEIDSYQSPYSKAIGDVLEIIRPLRREYCLKTAGISLFSGLLPGILGGLSVLPEMYSILRLQVRMIKDIAVLYGKEKYLTKELILYCLFKQNQIDLFSRSIQMSGTRLLLRSYSAELFQKLLNKIGFQVQKKTDNKFSTRIYSIFGSTIGGSVTYFDTRIVAYTAVVCFSKDIIIIEDKE
jgi:hypothetical protein